MMPRPRTLVLLLSLCCLLAPIGCQNLGNGAATQPVADMLQITAASNRGFAITERVIADGLDLGLIPENDRGAIQEWAKVGRRWLDQMGIDARANNQISFQNSLREFSTAVTPLLVRQAEIQQKKQVKAGTTRPS